MTARVAMSCPWHASELVSFLAGLRPYQHPGSNQLMRFRDTNCIIVWILQNVCIKWRNSECHVSRKYLACGQPSTLSQAETRRRISERKVHQLQAVGAQRSCPNPDEGSFPAATHGLVHSTERRKVVSAQVPLDSNQCIPVFLNLCETAAR